MLPGLSCSVDRLVNQGVLLVEILSSYFSGQLTICVLYREFVCGSLRVIASSLAVSDTGEMLLISRVIRVKVYAVVIY